MWQKCPICNGTGSVWFPLSNSTSNVCTTCNGHKIISELTGLPPNTTNPLIIKSNVTTFTELPKTHTGDFRDDMCSDGK